MYETNAVYFLKSQAEKDKMWPKTVYGKLTNINKHQRVEIKGQKNQKTEQRWGD